MIIGKVEQATVESKNIEQERITAVENLRSNTNQSLKDALKNQVTFADRQNDKNNGLER